MFATDLFDTNKSFSRQWRSFDPPTGVLFPMSLHVIYKNAFAAMNAQQGHMAAVIKRQKEAGKLKKHLPYEDKTSN